MNYRRIRERLHREHVQTIRWVRRRPIMSQNDQEPTIMAELVAKELREIFESITRFGIHSVETLEKFPDALLFLFQSLPPELCNAIVHHAFQFLDAQEITTDRLLLEANLLEKSPTDQRAVYALATILALAIQSGNDLPELIAIKRGFNDRRFPEHRFQTGTYPAAYAACKAEEREKQLKNTHLYPMLEAVLARRQVVRT